MAEIKVCDGCGKPGELETRGLFRKRDYCPDCLPSVDTYLTERDEAHDKAAALFNELHDAAKAKVPFPLPDM